MTYERFRATVAEMVDDVPDAFLQDLQGVHALPDVKEEEGYRDVFRMGEYLDPGPDDFLGGAEGLGRHVALYWGSFARIADGDPDFDWEEEIWETLTHELQHHVESLAGDGRLIEMDLLDAEGFERAGDAGGGRADDGRRDTVDDPAYDDPADEGSSEEGPADDAPEDRADDRGGPGGWLRRLFGGGS